MTTNLWFSVGLGVGIGVMYSLASYATARWAMRFSGKRFMLIFFGGMVVRIGVAAALVTLALLLLPVQMFVFLVMFLAVYVIWLVAEIWLFHVGRLVPQNNG